MLTSKVVPDHKTPGIIMETPDLGTSRSKTNRDSKVNQIGGRSNIAIPYDNVPDDYSMSPMKRSTYTTSQYPKVNQNVHSLSCVSNKTYNTQGILIDTGASCHIIYNKGYFQAFDEDFVPSKNYLEMADGSRRNDLIFGKGNAIIPLYDESGIQRNLVLKNALYVPSFKKNIMSLHNAVQDGVKFNLNSPGKEHMITKNGVTFKIHTSGHLYVVNAVISKSPVTKSARD